MKSISKITTTFFLFGRTGNNFEFLKNNNKQETGTQA